MKAGVHNFPTLFADCAQRRVSTNPCVRTSSGAPGTILGVLCSRTRTSRRPSHSGSHSWTWWVPKKTRSWKTHAKFYVSCSLTKIVSWFPWEAATVVLLRPSSRGSGTIRIPRSGGEEPVTPASSTLRPSSRGPGAIRVPGARGEKHVNSYGLNFATVSARSGNDPRPRFSR